MLSCESDSVLTNEDLVPPGGDCLVTTCAEATLPGSFWPLVLL